MPNDPRPLRVLAWPPGAADELNPYTRLIYSAFAPPAARILPFSPLMRRVPDADIFHIQWPEAIFEGRGGGHRPVAYLKAWRILRTARRVRAAGGVVALTAHNLTPHATPDGWRARLWVRFHEALLRRIDLLIGLTQGGIDQFVALHPASAAAIPCVIPHPHYRTVYPQRPRAEARREMDLPEEATIVGIVGSLRPGKNVPAAIAAFRGLEYADRRLMIAGGCGDDQWREIEHAAGGDPRVILRRGKLNDSQMATAVSAIDIMLVNQEATLNSGSALMALSLDRQLIAPGVGGIPELRAFVGEGHVATFDPPLLPAGLHAAIDELVRHGHSRCAALDALDPLALSNRLLAAMRAASPAATS